jgi:hypothetical protein
MCCKMMGPARVLFCVGELQIKRRELGKKRNRRSSCK